MTDLLEYSLELLPCSGKKFEFIDEKGIKCLRDFCRPLLEDMLDNIEILKSAQGKQQYTRAPLFCG